MTATNRAPLTSVEAPEDSGEKFLTIARGTGQELRVRLKTYNGRSYLDCRLWSRSGAASPFFPTQKGLTIRKHEIADMIKALDAARGAL